MQNIEERTETSALTIAKYIISECSKENCSVNLLELQALLYRTQRYCLVARGLSAFDDDFIAAPIGPIVPAVYQCFADVCPSRPIPCIWKQEIFEINPWKKEAVNKAVRRYMRAAPKCKSDAESAVKNPLAYLKSQGLAWSKVYNGGEGKGKIIPKELLKKDCSAKLS